MKSAVISSIILIALFFLVGVNTAVVDDMLDNTIVEVENLRFDSALQESFDALRFEYEKNAKYIKNGEIFYKSISVYRH